MAITIQLSIDVAYDMRTAINAGTQARLPTPQGWFAQGDLTFEVTGWNDGVAFDWSTITPALSIVDRYHPDSVLLAISSSVAISGSSNEIASFTVNTNTYDFQQFLSNKESKQVLVEICDYASGLAGEVYAHIIMTAVNRGFGEATGSQLPWYGLQGPQGLQGSQGPQGTIGFQGALGTQGAVGSGTQGVQGPAGSGGSGSGTQGFQGPIGYQGNDGTDGTNGLQGDIGTQGYIGFQGSDGPAGLQGFIGLQGNQGDDGDTGTQGPQGPPSILTSDTTVNIPVGTSTTAIQALIDAQLTNLGTNTLTFQFADGTHTLTDILEFNNFQNGLLRVLGNSSDSTLSTSKSVDIVAAADSNGLVFDSCDNIEVKFLDIELDPGTTQVLGISFVRVGQFFFVDACYVHGDNVNYAYGINSTYASHGWIRNTYVNTIRVGILCNFGGNILSQNNDDTGTSPFYGLYALNGAVIAKSATQPTGSVSDELTGTGGVIR